jgi:NAD(P)-dependent dehydrogenase (short-subunit alcohol dehydrogenase family)
MPSLKDRTVLITGRGSGIARAIALAVSEDGGRVIAAGRHREDLAGVSIPVDGGEHLV